MSTQRTAVAFVVGLAVVFGTAFSIGRLFDDGERAGHGHEDGYSLRLSASQAEPSTRVGLSFVVLDPKEDVVTDFAVKHEKKLHLIAVRTDFNGYRHLHPRLGAGGTWSVDADLDPGPWRLYADYQPTGGEPTVTVADLTVAGDYAPDRPTSQARSRSVDGFRVTLSGALTAGADSDLSFAVEKVGGEPVLPEPYLGARGHLVVIRERDMAYQHAHPGDGGRFGVHVATEGRYHLYLDFKVDGDVHTAAFLVEAGAGPGAGHGGMDHGGSHHGDH